MRKINKISVILILILSVAPIQSSSALTIGCSKAQAEAKSYLSKASIGMKLEQKYYRMGIYDDAFRHFQAAVNDYYYWNSVITKSPRCFTPSYISNNKKLLKSVSINQTMASRYGLEIAKRNNYGSPDPCFRYLGDDEAYLECSVSLATRDSG